MRQGAQHTGKGVRVRRNRVVGDFWGNSPSEKGANVVRITHRRLFGGLVGSGLVQVIGMIGAAGV